MPVRLRLPPAAGRPLWKRLDAAIRGALEEGRLRPGDRLPSVADLAKDLSVSRLTVLKVFRLLEKEGLLASHVGRGTFVTGGASQGGRSRGPAPAVPASDPKPEVARALRRLREGWARGLRELMSVERRPGTIDLAGGVPSPDTVPEGLLERLARQAVRTNPRRLYAYAGPAGLTELREAIAKTLARSGTDVAPDEVIVTNGSQQAVSLVAAWAREDGRHVLCETPTYQGLPGAFMLFGHAVQSVPWEGAALDPAALSAAARDRRPLLYACPDFHNPTGLSMPEAARTAVVSWARETGAVVLDDQIFRDLRFEGAPLRSLYSMAAPGRRFLVGSVSKSFMTGLRVGFLAADAATVRELLPYKRAMDLGSPSLVQAIAAAFLEDGYVEHVAKVRALYRARRDAAVEALAEHMPAGTTWTRPEGGFQLWVTLPAGLSSIQLFLAGVERGVAVTPGPAHDVDGRYVSSFRLGYGSAKPEEVRTGVLRLGEAARALRSAPALDAPSLALPV